MFQKINSDKIFNEKIWNISLPLILQNLISSSVNLANNFMIGSFGDTTIAAVSLANQIFFLYNLLIFGAVSGGIVIKAQLWGEKDISSIKKVLGTELLWCLVIGILFSCLTFFIPDRILYLYSLDSEVVKQASQYMSILSSSFIFLSITLVFSGTHRSVGNTLVPMLIACTAFFINLLLNYVMIFGKLGFPRLGLVGSGFATLFSRIYETIVLVLYTYLKKTPVAGSMREIFSLDKKIVKITLKNIIPITVNEGLYGFGSSIYYFIYARISTVAITAVGAVVPIDNLMYTFTIGISSATSVIIGNLLGADLKYKASEYAKKIMLLTFSIGILVGGIVFFLRSFILSVYNLSFDSFEAANQILAYLSIFFCTRSMNYIIMGGILRAGGDVKISFYIDIGVMMLIGIPLAYLLSNVFQQPIQIVYLAVIVEHLVKLTLMIKRYQSGIWNKNLVKKN